MKPPAKPISSPGRTDKFPPPLMRFLRNNAGSRSRGRSRSTTMFLRKKNTATETQEPSSPKVTCMGQVRVKPSGEAPTKCRCCCWVPHRLISVFRCQRKPVWPNWGLLKRKKSDSKVTEGTELNFRVRRNPNYDESEHEDGVTPGAFVSNSSTTPPRNALLLTRCRSAPGRRFWNEEAEVENRVNREPAECNDRDPKLEAKLRFFKELEESLRERIMESEKTGGDSDSDSARPLALTRCKSEPARTAQKLDPEVSKKTTLGFAHVCFSHGV